MPYQRRAKGSQHRPIWTHRSYTIRRVALDAHTQKQFGIGYQARNAKGIPVLTRASLDTAKRALDILDGIIVVPPNLAVATLVGR